LHVFFVTIGVCECCKSQSIKFVFLSKSKRETNYMPIVFSTQEIEKKHQVSKTKCDSKTQLYKKLYLTNIYTKMVYVHINDMNFISSNNSTIHRVLKLHLLFSSFNQIIQDKTICLNMDKNKCFEKL
jgi:hypothetical protein